MNTTYYILKKDTEEIVATTYSKQYAELIIKNIGFECIIRIAEYRTGIA